jgi:hypothetical protein
MPEPLFTVLLLGYAAFFLNCGSFRPLARPGIGAGALAMDREGSSMTKSAVASKIHKTLDIHGNLGTEFAFHLELTVNDFTDIINFGFRQIIGLGVRINIQLPEYAL